MKNFASAIDQSLPKKAILGQKLRKVRFAGSAIHLPLQKVTSAFLDQRFGKPDGWTERKSGVAWRHFAETETATAMAAAAARSALQSAQLSPNAIDCVIAASATQDQGMPCNAALLHYELGLSASQIPAFDVNNSCLSFLTALEMASYLLQARRFRRILIASSDIASRGLDWNDWRSSLIFGDGAAAWVVESEEDGAADSGASTILASSMKTLSEGRDLCRIRAGGSRYHPLKVGQEIFRHAYFEMDGKAVYRLIADHLPAFIAQLLAEAQITLDDIDWVIPHQASGLALRHFSDQLGIPPSRLMNIFSTHGNQVAASLPTAFHLARQQGRIKTGDTVLLIGTAAGVSMGGMILRYEN